MTPKRKAAQTDILKYIDAIAKGGQNKKLYEDLFKSMSDKEFDKFMLGLKNKTITLCVVVPHDGSVKITVKNNEKVAKSLGYEFFQRLRMVDSDTKESYLTPNKYFVYKLPVRRTAQLLIKGISVPKDIKSTDALTGQVANASRSSKITMPETQMLIGMGLEDTVEELLKFRGGDLGSRNAMMNILYKQGRVDKKTLEEYGTGVEATKTLKNYFLGAHIRSSGLDNA